MSFEKQYQQKLTTIDNAVASIQDNTTVHVGCAGAICTNFANKLLADYHNFNNLTLVEALALRPLAIKPEIAGHIMLYPFFVGPFERAAIGMKVAKFSSVNFSTLDLYFERVSPSDVVIFESPPMTEDGYFNGGIIGTGINHDVLRSNPRIIIQMNDKVPFVHGEMNMVHIDKVDMIYEVSEAPGILPQPEVTDIDNQIASHIIDLIPDGATIQIGLGGTANAVGYMLGNKKDLGVHTEMLTDSMVELAKKGVINGAKNNLYPNKIVTSLGLGSPELYAFMDHNPDIVGLPLSVLAKPQFVSQINNFISINNALSVDLTGQIAAEGLGFKQFSTTGGQSDFVRGALYSPGGKSIICLPSTATAKDGTVVSRITLEHLPGTPITTQRSDAQYIATEYGCVNIWAQAVNKKVELMISIAHPDFREELTHKAKKAGLLY